MTARLGQVRSRGEPGRGAGQVETSGFDPTRILDVWLEKVLGWKKIVAFNAF
jgi:hypothetical protein